jgi:4-carboxymuconolactone decarboxylase
MPALDAEERALVRLSAAIAAGGDGVIRAHLARAVSGVRPEWVEEVILQSYLFAGFPRALNAAREWRRLSGRPAPSADDGERLDRVADWKRAGERTCQTVYGPFYHSLRRNIRQLHPALDAWMIVEGYGKVLSRPALDLARRELCIVAACAAAEQDRQLHSHLHGALHAGATAAAVSETLAAITDLLDDAAVARSHALWQKVQASHVH